MQKKLIFIVVICVSFFGFSQNDWSLKKEADNIKIYTRQPSNSSIKEYKAVTTIATNINYVLEELLEAPNYYEGCESNISYYVKELDDNKHVFYAHKDLPWPIKDRDVVTLLTVEPINKKTIKLTLESLPDEIPHKSKTIRIKKLMGHWLLEDMGGKTMVTQQLFLDPEGSLPPLIVNKLLIKGPYKTFKNLHNTIVGNKSF
ncbi:START domain-containing protein [uncultured Psychroserpens sp.]|uniref:START domain-containing protein n=1 Tax=uncultured Psychroserpens sp. TaxID=255436 RepID=UPI00261DE802|nr:START domain-containing protein [uncultured Psychroserpens sp.]